MRIRTTHFVEWPGVRWNPFLDGDHLCYSGMNSIDWPLRIRDSVTIRLTGDWMDSKYSINWQSLALATMALASSHAFITLTRNWKNLFAMLSQINDIEDRAIPVPADTFYVRAIERANRYQGAFNLARYVNIPADPARAKKAAVLAKEHLIYAKLPWLPRNIFFGVETDGTILGAEETVFVLRTARRLFPEGRFMIYQPAGQVIDWHKLGLERGTIDWLICCEPEGWEFVRDFGRKTGTKVYIDEVSRSVPLQETPELTGVLV